MSAQLTPVHECAEALGLKVFTPENFKTPETVSMFASHKADLAVVVAYGLILPESVLSAPVKGCWNIHASLLPRWRGADTKGDNGWRYANGICIMQMEVGLILARFCYGMNLTLMIQTLQRICMTGSCGWGQML